METNTKSTPSSKLEPRGSATEASSLFPLPGSIDQPQTTYKSSYFQESYLFPWNPDPLCSGNSYKIYDEMKNDDQVKAALSFKKDIVINPGWKIVSENEDVKKFLEDDLNEMLDYEEMGKSFDDILRDLLSVYEYGFAIAEPVFRINSKNLYEIKSVKVRPPHSFRFDIDRFGNVLKIIQATDRDNIELDPTKFIHHVYQQEYGNPYGKADLRSAHEAWKAKKFFTRFYAMYVEKFAGPTVVGKYDPNMEQSEIAAFFSKLKTMANASTFMVPSDSDIELIQSQRDASSAYKEGLDMFNLWIARALLVPDLLGISGEKTSGGSYSLGLTQFKMFLNSVEKDRKSLSKKINLKLVKPIVLVNWGEGVEAKFEFNPISEGAELDYSKVWSDFMKSRIVKPTEEEVNHFRRSVKFPEGEVELQEPPPNPLDPNNPNNQDGNGLDKKGNLPGDKNKLDKAQADKEKQMSLKVFRELNAYEKIVNFTETRAIMEKSEAKILPLLKRSGLLIYKDFIDQVRKSGMINNFNPEVMNQIQPRFLRDMNEVLRAYYVDVFKQSYDQAKKEIFPYSDKKFSDSELLPEEFLRYLQAESFKNVGDYSIEITKKGKNILSSGIKNGVNEREILKSMEGEMKDTSDKWLETVSRTKTTEIYNTARKSYWDNDPVAKQIIEAYEFSAILDDRTSECCAFLDGKIFEKGGEIDRLTPPLHFNCRSILVPVTKFTEYKTSPDPSLDKIKAMGGNLIV